MKAQEFMSLPNSERLLNLYQSPNVYVNPHRNFAHITIELRKNGYTASTELFYGVELLLTDANLTAIKLCDNKQWGIEAVKYEGVIKKSNNVNGTWIEDWI